MNNSLGPRGSRSPVYLVIATGVSFLGGFLFGYDNIVISGAIGYLSRIFHLDPMRVGWAAGCALIGCIVGCAGAGAVVDRLGLKKGLGLCAACFALSSVGIYCFAHSLHQFVAWRMLAGVGIGAASIISPMYIAEIAPTKYRGRLVALYQMGIVVGILAAVFANMLIQRMGNDAWNTTMGWREMFLAGLIPAVVFGATILPSPESPRWLIKMRRRQEGLCVLSKLYDPDTAQREADAIEESLILEEGRLSELFGTFLQPLLLGIMLAGLQQASGITPIFSFLPEIFRAAGAATSDAFFQSVLVSVINLAFTFIALWWVDKAGRKTLIIGGTTVQCISLALVGWFYHVHGSGIAVLTFVMSYVAGHAAGNGVAMWVIISEIYPTKVRGRAMSVATTTLWVVGYLWNQLFPLMMKRLGSDGTFWTFSSLALMTIILVSLLVPETKGRSLEEITKFWTRRRAGAPPGVSVASK